MGHYARNQGEILENMIEGTNEMYKRKGWAVVDKVPTPWSVKYDKYKGKAISAYPQEKSTVDFVGISHGRGIAFDAKSTTNKTSFPMKNIKPHQVEYLKQFQDQGGIAFMIIDFSKLSEMYFVPIDQLAIWWDDMIENDGRKSIPYDWFKFNCPIIRPEGGVLAHYLKHCQTVN